MAAKAGNLLKLTLIFFTNFFTVTALEYCDGNYWCEHGHCCGHGRCCTYYYEVWWFWVIWLIIALMVGCCFYQQKRLRLQRMQLFSHLRTAQVGRQTAGGPPVEPAPPGVPFVHSEPSGVQPFFQQMCNNKPQHLPSYDEVQDLPKDPPTYDMIYSPGATAAATAPSTDISGLPAYPGATGGDVSVASSQQGAAPVTDISALSMPSVALNNLTPPSTTTAATNQEGPVQTIPQDTGAGLPSRDDERRTCDVVDDSIGASLLDNEEEVATNCPPSYPQTC